MKRGEVYFVSLDPIEGHEQRGFRPVLIVSPDDFNEVNRLPLIVPITSGGAFARNRGFSVPIEGHGTKTKTSGIVLCNQLRALDVSARGGKRVEKLPAVVVNEVLDRLKAFFE